MNFVVDGKEILVAGDWAEKVMTGTASLNRVGRGLQFGYIPDGRETRPVNFAVHWIIRVK